MHELWAPPRGTANIVAGASALTLSIVDAGIREPGFLLSTMLTVAV